MSSHITIQCKKCDCLFYQKAANHLMGNGCPKCRNWKEISKNVRLTPSNFIERAKKIHGERYGYDISSIRGTSEKVKIICTNHGPFYQNPITHLKGHGCPKCGQLESRKKPTSLPLVISLCSEIHESFYDYTLVSASYKTLKSEVSIICPMHGIFQQRLSQHIVGRGCSNCGMLKNQVSRKMTRSKFVQKSTDLYPGKYEYFDTRFINWNVPVKISCNLHGVIEVNPRKHLYDGHGCSICTKVTRTLKNASTFIEMSRNVHGHKYDYDFVDYISAHSEVRIGCPVHGFFWQLPTNHLRGSGCFSCGRLSTSKKLRKSVESFLDLAIVKFSNRYVYDLSTFRGRSYPINIKCPEHGTFLMSPKTHLKSTTGCRECSLTISHELAKSNPEQFIEEASNKHFHKFQYSLECYFNRKTKIVITCPSHGEFLQTPERHLASKYGCQMCAIDQIKFIRTSSFDEVLENFKDVHGETYDYSSTAYINGDNAITIGCRKHGNFSQTPQKHAQGQGCPKCRRSLGENKIARWLESKNIEYIEQWRDHDCIRVKPLSFDFFIPSHNLIIEYDGLQHFKPISFGSTGNAKNAETYFLYIQQNDLLKNEWAKLGGFNLIRIRYDEEVEQMLNQKISI